MFLMNLYLFSKYKIKTDALNLSIPVEPTFIASCQTHLGVGFNNRAWFYMLHTESSYSLVFIKSLF